MEGEIVIYKGKPALIVGTNGTGKTVSLKLARNHYMTVLKEEVTPYTGKEDAVSLGLQDKD